MLNKRIVKFKIKIILLALTTLLQPTIISCQKPTEPVDDEKKIKEIKWSEEKLIQSQGKGVVPTAIWGSATDDIWAVGWNTSWQGEIFHYDGEEWKNVTPKIYRNTTYNDVYGFGKNDIYVVGFTWWQQPTRFVFSSLILHYDGKNWSILVEDSTNQGYLNKIHGNSKDNIWAVGANGSIYHYDGVVWNRKQFIDTFDVYSVYCPSDGRVYFINEYYNYPVTEGWAMLYFSEYASDYWVNKDSCKLEIIKGEKSRYKFGYKAMWGESSDKLYSVCPGAHYYNNSSWKLDVWDDYYFNDIKGVSAKNIYAVGEHGIIFNYDGAKWNRVGKYASTTVDFKAVMPFENTIFILGYYQGDSWIVKGDIVIK